MVRIVFIDDDPNIHTVLQLTLPDECAVIPATDGKSGLRLVEEEDPDLVLLDIGLPDCDGMVLLRRILGLPGAPPVVMLTASNETEKVVESIKIGALDYIVKPFTPRRILSVVHSALRLHLADRTRTADARFAHIIGSSPAIREVKRRIAMFAPSDSPVLILGETGTGKELVAHTIHDLSARQGEVFVAVNCGAIPDSLMETELFGSEKGAYTDAVTRSGIFERAHRGTIFLDEIGEMSPRHQVKLLRVIEEKSFIRVGGVRSIGSDCRIVTATNRSLQEEVERGTFRGDLFYRISTLPLEIPPLRARKTDIPELARFFLDRYTHGRVDGVALTSAAIEKLLDHDWPGNIRELRNVIERALLFSEGGPLEPRHLFFA